MKVCSVVRASTVKYILTHRNMHKMHPCTPETTVNFRQAKMVQQARSYEQNLAEAKQQLQQSIVRLRVHRPSSVRQSSHNA